jgi:hypothetical protein
MFSDQLAFLRASFANEVISSTGNKENDVGVSVWGKCTREDLFALANISHGCVVHIISLGRDSLLLAMGWMVDVAMSGVLLWSNALSGEVAHMITVEADGAEGGSSSQWCK